MTPAHGPALIKFVIATFFGALIGHATSAHALNSECRLGLYRLPGVASDAAKWSNLGFVVDVDVELKNFFPEVVGRVFYSRPIGTSMVFSTGTDFSLMSRPTWRDPNTKSGAAALSLNRRAFTKAYSMTRPSCAALSLLIARAKPRFESSYLALALLDGGPAGRNFVWSDFFLSFENAMYLADGQAIDSNKLMARQREWTETSKSIASRSNGDLSSVAQLVRSIYDQNHLREYCFAKNTTYSGTQLQLCTSCQGQTWAILSGFLDSKMKLPKDHVLGVQIFSDHVRPVLFDTIRWRFKDLVTGGGWINKITSPIYRPEFLLDQLLRAPISGLNSLTIRARLPERDPYHFVIADAGEETSRLPTWIQRRFKTPRLVDQGSPAAEGHGLVRYLRTLPTVDFKDSPPAAFGTSEFKDFEDSVIMENPHQERAEDVRESPVDSSSNEPDFTGMGIAKVMSIENLPPADAAILEPLKPFVRPSDDGTYIWNDQPLPPEAKAQFVKAVQRFSIETVAKRLAPGRAGLRQTSNPIFKFDLIDLDALLLHVSPAEQERLSKLWPKLSLVERAVEYDRVVEALWDKTMSDDRFAELVSYLGGPTENSLQSNPRKLRSLTRYLYELLNIARLLNDQKEMLGDIHIGPSVFRGLKVPKEGLITRGTITLAGAIFDHAQRLTRDYRSVISRGSHWTSEEAAEFAKFHLQLTEVMELVLYRTRSVDEIRAKWPEYERSPNLFYRSVTHPLQGVYQAMIDDRAVRYIVSSIPDADLSNANPKTFGIAADRKRSINVPIVDWGIPDVCDGARSGTNVYPGAEGNLSGSIAIECPESARIDRVARAISPEWVYALIVNQPREFIHLPSTHLITASYWTNEVEQIASRQNVMPLELMHQRLFGMNPLLLNHPLVERDRDRTMPPDTCAKTFDVGFDWQCLLDWPRSSPQKFQSARVDLSWVKTRAEYREGYQRYKALNKKYQYSDLPRWDSGDDWLYLSYGQSALDSFRTEVVIYAFFEGRMVTVKYAVSEGQRELVGLEPRNEVPLKRISMPQPSP